MALHEALEPFRLTLDMIATDVTLEVDGLVGGALALAMQATDLERFVRSHSAEPELHLGPEDRPVVPDLAGWRRERVVGDFLEPAAIELRPDWVCEVLSDRTRSIDRVKKQRIYHRAGVSHVWHVDPEAQTFEVFRRNDEHWLLVLEAAGDERVRAEPFEDIELELSRFWTL